MGGVSPLETSLQGTALKTAGASAGEASHVLVAVMNIIFAYGGQFAFVEVINSMQKPKQFPGVVTGSTLLMGLGYIGIGAIGYW